MYVRTHVPEFSPQILIFLSTNLENCLGRKSLVYNAEIIAETNCCSEELVESWYLEGVEKLKSLWTKCKKIKRDMLCLEIKEIFGNKAVID